MFFLKTFSEIEFLIVRRRKFHKSCTKNSIFVDIAIPDGPLQLCMNSHGRKERQREKDRRREKGREKERGEREEIPIMQGYVKENPTFYNDITLFVAKLWDGQYHSALSYKLLILILTIFCN